MSVIYIPYKGKAYLRIESTTTVMPQEQYNHLLMQRGRKIWLGSNGQSRFENIGP